jgi:acetylornithine deacetylase
MATNELTDKAVKLLSDLIATPSTSGNEDGTAAILHHFLCDNGIDCNRLYNNVWAIAKRFDPNKPTLLLNSHHDTVKPSTAYTRNPYTPTIEGDRIFGLGSNDAGASLVSLAITFCQLYNENLPFNIILALTAEEENMGEHGMRAMLPKFKELGLKIDMALVGEPTGMDIAIGERGLLVFDGVSYARGGHAARSEGENALYKAIDDINILRNYKFDKISSLLGDIKVTVTQITAGRQHNILPEECRFVVDVRTTDAYSNEETVKILQSAISSEIRPRSTRVRASAIDVQHPLVKSATDLGRETFTSPTTSDMALMYEFPSVKMGIGQSSRSHTADEFVCISEIAEGLDLYYKYILQLTKHIQ